MLDSNWRWVHNVGGFTDCFTGSEWAGSIWNKQYCPNNKECAKECAVDGVFMDTYGVTSYGSTLRLNFMNAAVGSRSYLMGDNGKYKHFHLKNKEFTFTVDVSNLPCGISGALYFTRMESDGGE